MFSGALLLLQHIDIDRWKPCNFDKYNLDSPPPVQMCKVHCCASAPFSLNIVLCPSSLLSLCFVPLICVILEPDNILNALKPYCTSTHYHNHNHNHNHNCAQASDQFFVLSGLLLPPYFNLKLVLIGIMKMAFTV